MLTARAASEADVRRRTQAAFAFVGTALGLLLWVGYASDRFADGAFVLGWTLALHLPTLALCYGLLGFSVARLPRRRAGQAVLAGFPAVVLFAQMLSLPGEDARSVALGFILLSALIVLAIGVRLAVWLGYEDGQLEPRTP